MNSPHDALFRRGQGQGGAVDQPAATPVRPPADTVIDRLHTASDSQLDAWAERRLDARSLTDVFGA